MAEPVLGLPTPLILLVHLHLLQYPLANNPEYDQHLFDPNVRGLRDRTKSMEDAFYFLVGKVEGRRESAKAILPTYPCLAPADTTAFRTSLAKYLETLRHSAIYHKHGSVNGPSSVRDKGKDKETVSEATEVWWWKDVVVRKSLLEECAGERFERLLLSLSTHALLQGISSDPSVPSNVTLESTAALFRTQPQTYAARLLSSRSARNTWEKSASLLQQREDDLELIRAQLADHAKMSSLKYDALPTDKLLALVNSKYEDLLREYWRGVTGRQALDTLIELAGFKAAGADKFNALDLRSSVSLGDGATNTAIKTSATPIQPLPIAAAHHPSSIRKLRTPIFLSSKKTAGDTGSNPSATRLRSHASIALSASLDAEKRIQAALLDTLARTKKIGEVLSERLNQMRVEESVNEKIESALNTTLWEEDESLASGVNFNTKPTPELLSSLVSHTAPPVGARESRIHHIRKSLLPAYPTTSKPTIEPPQSRLPRLLKVTPSISQSLAPPPNFHGQPKVSVGPGTTDIYEDETPQTPGRLITSTPPATVKPRSAFARRILASQSKEKRNGKVEFKVAAHSALRKSRKSVRMSLASARRPSLFEPPLSDEDDDFADDNEYENDVDRIVDAVQDESTSFRDSYATPKITRLPSPYKPRSASPFKKSNATPGPRPSFKIIERQSLAPLPDGITSADDLLYNTDAADINDEDWTDDDGEKDAEGGKDDDGDASIYEGKSVTLRDILLKASDDTQYDLLDGTGFELSDGSFAWG